MNFFTKKIKFHEKYNRLSSSTLFIFFLMAALVTPMIFSAAAHAVISMNHEAPDYFVADQRIRLEAQVEDASGIKLVRCYFKAAGEADLVFVPMDLAGKNEYTGILPAPSASTQQIEYLFLAVNNYKQVVRSQTFTITKNAEEDTPAWQEVPKEGEIKVSMELDKVPAKLAGFSDNVTIDIVESGARFGVVALLYHTAADASSKSALTSAASSTGATSGGTITAESAGWSTAMIVGVGVGTAAVVGGIAAASGGGGGGGGGSDAEDLDATTILGAWKFSGERRDGVRRTGTSTLNDGGTHEYTVKDADGQSDGSGSGNWTLSGTSLTMTFPGTISTLSGSVSGNSKKFTLDTTDGSNHGIYEFRR